MSKYAPHRPSSNNPRATSSTLCQKCLKKGHFTYQCKNDRPYVSRPSRTQQLEKPKLLSKLKAEGRPSVEVPEEFKKKAGTADKILETKEKERSAKKEIEDRKRKRSRSSDSSSESESDSHSVSESDSSSSSSESDSDSDSTSRSSPHSSTGSYARKRRRPRRRRSSSVDSRSSRLSEGRR